MDDAAAAGADYSAPEVDDDAASGSVLGAVGQGLGQGLGPGPKLGSSEAGGGKVHSGGCVQLCIFVELSQCASTAAPSASPAVVAATAGTAVHSCEAIREKLG